MIEDREGNSYSHRWYKLIGGNSLYVCNEGEYKFLKVLNI